MSIQRRGDGGGARGAGVRARRPGGRVRGAGRAPAPRRRQRNRRLLPVAGAPQRLLPRHRAPQTAGAGPRALADRGVVGRGAVVG
eukprot:3543381-Rhodomonas_salina.1